MTRDLFPFASDRALIDRFLAGDTTPGESQQLDVITAGTSVAPATYISALWLKAPLGCVVATIRSDGTMHGNLDVNNAALHYVVKVQNYILERLGDPRRITMKNVEREARFAGEVNIAMAPHIDDVELPVSTPWVIAGPLSLKAHRAEKCDAYMVGE